MKRTVFTLLLIINIMSIVAQTNKEVLNLIQVANDSIENGQIEGAKRILVGLSVYDSYTDTIQMLNKKMKEKSLSLAYEAYTQQEFDLAQNYYYAVTDSSGARPYWIDNASKMDYSKKIEGYVDLCKITYLLVSILTKEKFKRKMFKKEYEEILAIIVKGIIRDTPIEVIDLIPFMDEITEKWGYKDSKGVVIIPAVYDLIISKGDCGISLVVKDGLYGYLHQSGVSVFDMNDELQLTRYTTYDGQLENIVSKEDHIDPGLKIKGKKCSISEVYKYIQQTFVY